MEESIRAYPREDNLYNIIGKRTYYYKDKIRAAGGKWNSTCWVGSIDCVKACNAQIMIRVLIKGAMSGDEYETWASQHEVDMGHLYDPDGIYDKIIKVINRENY
jgi:hypothetical protein